MTEKFKIILYCGPDGAGKDYLAGKALEMLSDFLTTAAMVTTRPARDPKVETKIPIEESVFDALHSSGELLGAHLNRGHKYAYRRHDLVEAKKQGKVGALLEVNPAVQAHLVHELKNDPDLQLVGWIGLAGDQEYLAQNIKSRDNSSDDIIQAKLEMAQQISDAISVNHKKGLLEIFEVGWSNRATMHEEYSARVAELLGISR